MVAVVRALASPQCGPGLNPGTDAIFGLSLSLALSLAPRGFTPGSPVFVFPQNQLFKIPIWNARTHLRTLNSFTSKHITASSYKRCYVYGLASPLALHLRELRDVTREHNAKGDASVKEGRHSCSVTRSLVACFTRYKWRDCSQAVTMHTLLSSPVPVLPCLPFCLNG